MTLADLGALGELIGGFAVIVSLIYVGLQIRQSADASRAATAQAFAKQYSDLNQMIADPVLSEIFVRGLDGTHSLSIAERASFMSILSSITRTLESFYFQENKGDLDPRLFDGWITQYLDLHANRGVQEYWRLRQHQFSKDFVDYLRRRSQGVTAKPLYDVDAAAVASAAPLARITTQSRADAQNPPP